MSTELSYDDVYSHMLHWIMNWGYFVFQSCHKAGVAHLHITVFHCCFDCNLQPSHPAEKKLFPLNTEDSQINFHIPALRVSDMHPCARVFVSAPHVRILA